MLSKMGSIVCLLMILAGARRVQQTGLSAQTVRSQPSNPSEKVRDEILAKIDQAYQVFVGGGYLQAEKVFEQACPALKTLGYAQSAGRCLTHLGNCRFATFRYREALATYLEARKLSAPLRDWANLGSLNGNISSLYLQMGELDAAAGAAQMMLENYERKDFPGARPRAFIQLGIIRAKQGRVQERDAFMREAIDAAYREGDLDLVAQAWDHWGEEYLESGLPAAADRALTEAFRLRKAHRLRRIDSSLLNLGRLRLAQGDLVSASYLLDRVIQRQSDPDSLVALWNVYHARGEVRMAQGKVAEAFGDFRQALDLARQWRLEVLPADAARISSEVRLQQIYASFIEAGNQLYFSTGRAELARETFRAAEENRASSLYQLLSEAGDWRRRLPAGYWEKLAKLHAVEVLMLRQDTAALRSRMASLRSEILAEEAEAGSNTEARGHHLFERTRSALPADAVLLSFHLGKRESYLWAVSREQFRIYRLPAKAGLGTTIGRFADAVRTGNLEARALGRQLYGDLFGRLDPQLERKPRWILALDENLFQVPFDALVIAPAETGPQFLMQRHSVEIATGALQLAKRQPESWSKSLSGWFLGVGDPIYNTADPRRAALAARSQRDGPVTPWVAFAAQSGGPAAVLTRLVGSASEIESCARIWDSTRKPVLLEGARASLDNVRQCIAAGPAVIHFGTHFIEAAQSPRYQMIALSLAKTGELELLSPIEITRSRTKAALVVLNGCRSGQAEVLPAAGLMGLTRAWLVAGARAAVATHWSTPDDNGAFFISFYTHLKEHAGAGPSEALRRARLDMLRDGGWRANPQYWATYFLLGDV